jgi:membrane protein DedA with SNARE-associated domain
MRRERPADPCPRRDRAAGGVRKAGGSGPASGRRIVGPPPPVAVRGRGIGNGPQVSQWVQSFGLIALFAIIALQAAGVPGPPGKTALIVASLLAAKGHMVLWQVLVVAAAAVFVGGLVGYGIGRRGGRPLLERWWPEGKLARLLARAEHFFDRHGPKSVFLLRFLPGFKVAIGPAAGVARMPLAQFVIWHLLAAIAFALTFGLLGYFAGAAAVNAVERFGTYAAFALAAVALVAAAVFWRLRRSGTRAWTPQS